MNIYWRRTRSQFLAMAICAIALGLLLLTVVIAGLVVHILTLIQVYQQPNFSPTAAIVVIGLVILADLITISWHSAFSGLLPYSSHERLWRLGKLMETDPKRSEAIFKSMVETQRRKGPIRRLLTRPTIPTDL
jgi:hypothetical protein